ncbi:MAG: ABC transporter permease [Candidatus Thermoplasmatota archaeon]|nr:ABC transporter permease [Candidatus Thermoplasmatota archaeon]
MAETILFKMAYRNLRRHFSRSVLAGLGIIIGVVAVTTIGILGSTVQITVSAQLSGLASDIMVMPVMSYSEYISEKQVRIIEKVPVDGEVTPIKQDMMGNVSKGLHSDSFRASLMGIDLDKARTLWYLESGRWPQGTRNEVVVGYRFAEDRAVRVGSNLYMNGETYRTVGVIEEQEGSASMIVNPNNAIVISEDKFDRLIGSTGYSYVNLKVNNVSDLKGAEEYIETRLNRKEDTVSVILMSDITESIENVFGTLTLVLTAIGAISLVVAGISILNVMLMSVLERTKEIGVMRAIGGYKEEVTRMFIYEALMLGGLASFIGMVFSLFGGYLVNSVVLTMFFPPRMIEQTGLTVSALLFSPQAILSIVEGFVIGTVVTFVSSIYPAYRAARMAPMEALRYE